MVTIIDQQVVLDEALVPSTLRLRIGRRNFRLPSDIQSKESTLEMLHISPRIPSQSFAELPFEEEILEFLRSNVDYAYLIWEDFVYQVEHKHQKRSNEMYYPRFTKVIIDYFMTRKPSILDETELIGITLGMMYCSLQSRWYRDTRLLNNTAAPKPKASTRKKKGGSASSTPPPTPIAIPTPTTTVVTAPRLSAAKGKQPARATTPTELTDVERIEAEQLKIVLKRSKQETHISQQRGTGTDEGTGSRPGVPKVPSDDSEEELSWNSSDDEDVDEHTKGREESEEDKTDESDDGSDDGNDDDNDETVKVGSERDEDDDDNDDEEELAENDDEDTESGKGGDEVSKSKKESDEEETRQEEEENFDPIPKTPEGSEDESNDEEEQDIRLSEEARIQEEEEANELYRDIDINQGRGLQLSQILKTLIDAGVESIFTTTCSPIVSLQTPTPIMTPSTIATITTSSDAPIPLTTIPSTIIKNLPTFNSVFRFDERLRALETTFSEYRQTNPFVDAMSAIPDIIHQYMTQQMTEVIREALVEAYDADKTILDTYGESTILKRRREDDDQEGPSAGSDRGSTTGSQSRQLSASESAFAEEPVQTTCQMEEPSHSVFETGADDQPFVQTSQHPEWFSQPSRPPSPDRDWNKTLPAAQG
nr:hypothetical protein [Tanacetum cinerariifolium]